MSAFAGKLSHLLGKPTRTPTKAETAAAAAAAAEAETGGNLKGHAGKTAGNEAYSESALSTRKLLHLPGCPAESADISKPTAEKASTAQWSTTERTPASESAETQTPPPRLPAKAEKH